MIGTLFSLFCLAAAAFAAATCGLGVVSEAILQSAQRAVNVTLFVLGSMGLWCGILNVFRQSGLTDRLSRLLSPILRRIFPTAWKTGNGKEEISASVAANLLGIGNAATPLAVSAMQKMARDNDKKERASDDMITFTVMNTAPFSLLPTTLISLRAAANSQNPTEILGAVWICSFCSCCVAILLARGLRKLWR